MKHIKQIQAILINQDDYDVTEEYKDVKNVWILMRYIMSDARSDDYSKFKLTLSPDIVGTVFRYNDGRMKCHLTNLSFQDDYGENELKEIIVADIKEEYVDLFLPDYLISDINVFSIMWDKLSTEMRCLITNIIGIRYGKIAEEKLRLCTYVSEKDVIRDFIKFERVISEQIKLIKELDDTLTNLKKITDEGDKNEPQ